MAWNTQKNRNKALFLTRARSNPARAGPKAPCPAMALT